MRFPVNEKEHFANVGRLRCVVTDRPNVTIHHAQGGSVGDRLAFMGYDPLKSFTHRGYGPALILPLAPELHSAGVDGIDGGIGRRTWEQKYGTQAEHLDEVGRLVGYSLWELFELWTNPKSSRLSGEDGMRRRSAGAKGTPNTGEK